MISLTRLNGQPFVLNALLIETVEATPDTLITLTTGKKYMVQEEVPQVVQLTTRFLADTHTRSILLPKSSGGS